MSSSIDDCAFVRAQHDALGNLATIAPLDEPVRVRRHTTVFVAEKAS